MKRILTQIAFLVAISFVIGMLVNFFHPQGIHPSLVMTGFKTHGPWSRISPDSAFILYTQNQAIFLDIRPPKEYRIDHIPHAHSVPFFSFFRNLKKFSENYSKEKTYVLYGDESTMHQAKLMSSQLYQLGYKQVATLYGGLLLWIETGYPIEKEKP